MADQPPPIQFEDIPLAHARQLTRGPRKDPEIYHSRFAHFLDGFQHCRKVLKIQCLPELTVLRGMCSAGTIDPSPSLTVAVVLYEGL